MKCTIVYFAALVLALPQTETAEDIYQAIDETGVKLGAYYGCYESDSDGLVCILPEEKEEPAIDKQAE